MTQSASLPGRVSAATAELGTRTLLGRVQPTKALVMLWMDEILQYLRGRGGMIPLKIPTNSGFPWFPTGAGFCTVSSPA